MGGGAFLDCATSIEVGDEVLVAFDVLIMDHDLHSVVFAERQNDVVLDDGGAPQELSVL